MCPALHGRQPAGTRNLSRAASGANDAPPLSALLERSAMATTDPTNHHRNFGSDVPVHHDRTPPHAEAMRIRHVFVDDNFVVLVENTWTVFHHRACFALRPRPRHFPLRSSFNAWRNVAVSAAARAPERAANGDDHGSHVDTVAARLQRVARAISQNLHEDSDSSSEGLDDAQRHHEEVQDALHDDVVRAETEVADHDGLPVRRRVLRTEEF